MKSMFKYNYTCPDIDKQIARAKSELSDHIESLILEYCPLVPKSVAREKADEECENLYQSLEDIFESVRASNSDIRDAAESEMRRLQEEIDDLLDRVNSLERQLGEG